MSTEFSILKNYILPISLGSLAKIFSVFNLVLEGYPPRMLNTWNALNWMKIQFKEKSTLSQEKNNNLFQPRNKVDIVKIYVEMKTTDQNYCKFWTDVSTILEVAKNPTWKFKVILSWYHHWLPCWAKSKFCIEILTVNLGLVQFLHINPEKAWMNKSQWEI